MVALFEHQHTPLPDIDLRRLMRGKACEIVEQNTGNPAMGDNNPIA